MVGSLQEFYCILSPQKLHILQQSMFTLLMKYPCLLQKIKHTLQPLMNLGIRKD